jgi:hypothetical protein
MGEMRNAYKSLVRKSNGLGNLGVDGRIIRVGRCGLDSFGSGEELVVGSCEHGNQPLGSIKGREFD